MYTCCLTASGPHQAGCPELPRPRCPYPEAAFCFAWVSCLAPHCLHIMHCVGDRPAGLYKRLHSHSLPQSTQSARVKTDLLLF